MRVLQKLTITILVLLLINFDLSILHGVETILPTLNEKSTLQDYINYALVNNPALKSYQNKWKAAMERIPQAKAFPDPEISYGYYSEEYKESIEPLRQTFGIMQKFP